jgi:hypothetical protein
MKILTTKNVLKTFLLIACSTIFISCKKEVKNDNLENVFNQKPAISKNLKNIVKNKLFSSDYDKIDWDKVLLKSVQSTTFSILEIPLTNYTNLEEKTVVLLSFTINEEFVKGQIVTIKVSSFDNSGQINGSISESDLDRTNAKITQLINGKKEVTNGLSTLSGPSLPQTYICLTTWYYLLDQLGLTNETYIGVYPTGTGGGGTSSTTYSYNSLYLTDILHLNASHRDWLNNHENEAQEIADFIEQSNEADPELDPQPLEYQPVQAMQAAKAVTQVLTSSSLYSYDEPTYNLLKQYVPIINGSTAQQVDIFWSNFSFHAASSADINPDYSPIQHYLYAFFQLCNSNVNNTFTGLSVVNLTTNYFQTITGQGLNAVFVNQAPILSTTDLTPIEFKRKTITNANGKKIDLVWYKDNVTNKITFGDRGQRRDILGIPKGDPRIAHHIMPVGVCNGTLASNYTNFHPAIQLLGSKGDFHMNQIENGIPNNNSGDHTTYTNNVKTKLDALWATYQQSGSTVAAYTILKKMEFLH